jgi:hypothetical protein
MSKHADGEELRTRLENAAIRDRDLDREVASDWSGVDTEAWHKLDTAGPEREVDGHGGAKSTSRRSIRR